MNKITEKYKEVERKERPDDYKNHFYSHFGFFDEHLSSYSYSKYYTTTYDLPTSAKA